LPGKQERFWAKLSAREAIEHADRSGNEIVTVRAGASPSGPKHIGNMNDQVRGHFIRMSIDALQRPSRHILTSDDMDPLRTVPLRLPDGDGTWRQTDERIRATLTEALGRPVCDVQDPYGCHRSYAEHFTQLMMQDLKAINIDLKMRYVSALYKEGAFDAFIKETLDKADAIREVLSRFQSRIPKDWMPLNPVCDNCGKLTAKVVAIDRSASQVTYECTDRVLHGKYKVKGCGHKGTTDPRRAKLPWRLEWVADWKIFNTDIEPFGKEHYEGSWKSGVALAKEVYAFEPPVPLVYEFFLIDGEKMSSRGGNVYLIRDLLRIAEPEVVRYLYVKKPLVQRDIAIKKIYTLVSEFDEMERLAITGKGERAEDARAYYWYVVGEPRGPLPYRLPYDLAMYITRFYSPEVALERLRKSGFVPQELSKEDEARAVGRLSKAKNWNSLFGESYEDDATKTHEVADQRIVESFNLVRREYATSELSGDELQELLYRTARQVGLPPSELFKEGYRLFLGSDSGPRLGDFLATLDKDYVLARLDSVRFKAAN
jgi:lysyl-tRNA synthetase class 1